MVDDSFIPTTLVGIKILAKGIKREHEVPHHLALDMAFQKAGYRDYKDTRKVLSSQPPEP
ncbi:hypothetical protein CRN80_08555 [Pseudomonas sp. FDAARGOS_380]|uniref:Uncharacterized protein n=1 Tax=Pseudomonas libanensis TaxID=75588 RepID=A0ABR5MDW3_9PSED|nr:hypothetical protein CRN80_08555 [Pseudomonas sp. FDAARGOS_380]KPG77521.1 hypothetical protein AEQ48_04045 [Pseudomonas libanensis]